MNILLRSTMVADKADKADLAYQNFLTLHQSGLTFDMAEDAAIWAYISDFSLSHNHSPDIATLRAHFTSVREDGAVNRLEALVMYQPVYRGDFEVRLTKRMEEKRVRTMQDFLRDAASILQTGLEVKENNSKKILHGPVDAMNFLVDRAHEIVAPVTNARLSGEVTSDVDDFLAEYDRRKADPLAGIGQFTGLSQMDDALSGAKRYELWTHAAFTGHMKCVAGDTRIFDLATGRLRTVSEIYESREAPIVHALEEASWRVVPAHASQVAQNGVRPILKLTTRKGRSIRVSDNHPFMLPQGWTEASQIKVGDWVAVPASLPNENTSSYTDDQMALVGYLIGDGHIDKEISFTNGSPEIINDFTKRLRNLGYTEHTNTTYPRSNTYQIKQRNNAYCVRVSRSTGINTKWVSPLRVLLEDLGLYGKKSEAKFIPNALWSSTDAQVWTLISALWSTDGRVGLEKPRGNRKGAPAMWYGTRSAQLAQDLQLLLQRVGVPTTVSCNSIKYKGTTRKFWTVLVTTTEGKRIFLTKSHIEGKMDAVREALQSLPEKESTDAFPPVLLDHLPDSLRTKTTAGGWHYVKWAKKKCSINRDTVIRFAQEAKDDRLLSMASGDVRWEQVSCIDEDGLEMTYDLSVPGPANFVANGFITHNTTFMLNWVYNQAVYFGHSSVLFSLEMPYDQVRRILMSIHSMHPRFRQVRIDLGLQTDPNVDTGLPYPKTRNGSLSDNEEVFLREYVAPDFKGHPVVPPMAIDPSGGYGQIHIEVAPPDKTDFTMLDVKSRAEVLYQKSPFQMLFLDHMGLLSPRKWVNSTTERLNEVVRDAKKLAMSFNRGQGMAVIGLFQISREGFKAAEKNDGNYNLTHLSYANECLVNVRIPTSFGLRLISQLGTQDAVWSRTGFKPVMATFDQGVRPTWLLTLDNNSTLEGTGNHRVRVVRGEALTWVTLNSLAEGDFLVTTKATYPWSESAPALPHGPDIKTPTALTPDLAYLLGAWDGAGSEGGPAGLYFRARHLHKAVKEKIKQAFDAAFGVALLDPEGESFNLLWRPEQDLALWVKDLSGPCGQAVPEVVWQGTKELVREYLRGLFDTCGTVNSRYKVRLSTQNEAFLREIQLLLTMLGIAVSLERKVEWYLEVKGTKAFAALVGFTDQAEAYRLSNATDLGHKERVPFPEMVYRVAYKHKGMAFHRKLLPYMAQDSLPKGLALEVLDAVQGANDPEAHFLREALDTWQFQTVKTCKPTGRQEQVYDIEVNGDHEYQSGPVLSHNCERSSDIVTTSYISEEMRKENKVRFQNLKTRDDKPFDPFFARVEWPYRRILQSQDFDVVQSQLESVGDEIDATS